MKHFIIVFLSLAISAYAIAASETEELTESYNQSLNDINLHHTAQGQQIGARYVASLDILEKTARKNGNLDRVIDVKKAKQQFEQTKIIERSDGAFDELAERQIMFQKMVQKNDIDRAKQVVRLADLTDKRFQNAERNATRKSDDELAIRIRKARVSLQKSKDVTDARQLAGVKADAPRKVENTPSAYRWTFDGKSMKNFKVTGPGQLIEAKGRVSAKLDEKASGWHGPTAKAPVKADGDFALTARFNCTTEAKQIGRVRVQVGLSSGQYYEIRVIDDHVDVNGFSASCLSRNKSIWTSGRDESLLRLADVPMTIKRSNRTLNFYVNGKRRGSLKNCDSSKVTSVSFSIEKYKNYKSLTVANISEIALTH